MVVVGLAKTIVHECQLLLIVAANMALVAPFAAELVNTCLHHVCIIAAVARYVKRYKVPQPYYYRLGLHSPQVLNLKE